MEKQMKNGVLLGAEFLSSRMDGSRIVSLVPSQTELLAGLGLENEVVGITKFCKYPEPWHQEKTRVGGTRKIDLEKIKSLRPTLIIANHEENTKEEIEALAKDFPVYVTDVKDLEEAYKMIQEIGRLVGREKESIEITQKIQNEFKKVNLDELKPIRVVYFIWRRPWMTVGGDTFIEKMLQRGGFVNVFGEQDRYPSFEFAELKEKKPEVILLSSEPFPFKKRHIPEIKEAFPDIPIILVDGEPFTWYGTHLLKTPDYLLDLRRKIEEGYED